jgi:hypothetical protein
MIRSGLGAALCGFDLEIRRFQDGAGEVAAIFLFGGAIFAGSIISTVSTNRLA